MISQSATRLRRKWGENITGGGDLFTRITAKERESLPV